MPHKVDVIHYIKQQTCTLSLKTSNHEFFFSVSLLNLYMLHQQFGQNYNDSFLWVLFFLIVIYVPITLFSFDILGCVANTCGRTFGIEINKDGWSKYTDVGDPPMYVEGQWIKSGKLENSRVYIFAKDAQSVMTILFEADRHCERHDAS